MDGSAIPEGTGRRAPKATVRDLCPRQESNLCTRFRKLRAKRTLCRESLVLISSARQAVRQPRGILVFSRGPAGNDTLVPSRTPPEGGGGGGRIAELKWLETETFVAEDVEVFFKAFA